MRKIFFLFLFVVQLKFDFSSANEDDECRECCNLVYRTRVHDWPETSRKIWAAYLEWHLDDHEMRTFLGRVDRYEIRHGKLTCWGGRIDENNAHYLTLPGNNASLTLHKLQLGYYGIQICSFNNRHSRDRNQINWNDAWIGTLNVGNVNGHDKHLVKAADIPHSTCQSNAHRLKINYISNIFFNLLSISLIILYNQ